MLSGRSKRWNRSIITEKDIIRGFKELGVAGERVVLHSSLRSLGEVVGGAETVIGALTGTLKTVMMPAFCWDSNTAPPADDRPRRNGCDYSYYDNWQKPLRPFIIETAGIEKSMGEITATRRRR
jgi:hypothetical protein